MTDTEKIAAGIMINCLSEDVHKWRIAAEDACFELNHMPPSDKQARAEQLVKILPNVEKPCEIDSPFQCEIGFNIRAGKNFHAEAGLLIFDFAAVTFGDNVHIGPRCTIVTSFHPMSPTKRDTNAAFALPINIGSNVLLGPGVRVIGGVTIGSNVVIGAGSVVTRDIPDNCIAEGSPCRAVRRLEE